MRKKWTTPRLSPIVAYSEQHSQISETITQLSMTWYSQYSQIKSMEVKDWRLDYLPQKIFQNQDEKLKKLVLQLEKS